METGNIDQRSKEQVEYDVKQRGGTDHRAGRRCDCPGRIIVIDHQNKRRIQDGEEEAGDADEQDRAPAEQNSRNIQRRCKRRNDAEAAENPEAIHQRREHKTSDRIAQKEEGEVHGTVGKAHAKFLRGVGCHPVHNPVFGNKVEAEDNHQERKGRVPEGFPVGGTHNARRLNPLRKTDKQERGDHQQCDGKHHAVGDMPGRDVFRKPPDHILAAGGADPLDKAEKIDNEPGRGQENNRREDIERGAQQGGSSHAENHTEQQAPVIICNRIQQEGCAPDPQNTEDYRLFLILVHQFSAYQQKNQIPYVAYHDNHGALCRRKRKMRLESREEYAAQGIAYPGENH